MKKVYLVGLSVLVSGFIACSSNVLAESGNGKKFAGEKSNAKNVIFMVPDGMGISNVTAARIFQNGPDGARLAMETLDVIGYQSTHAANSTVTDSAAAATAWAVGQKANNGEISCTRDPDPSWDGDCNSASETILEIANSMGKATGLVATSQISHATPAAFGAHAGNRYCGEEIARQYIENTGIDVILGGGVYYTNDAPSRCPWAASLPGTGMGQDGIITSAINNGYTVVETESELNAAVDDKNFKILGLFTGFNSGKTVEYFRVNGTPYPDEEPTLAEMTSAALDILEEDPDGFFLMVEGSQIDWEDHANNVEGQIAETLGFNAAVEEVLNWVNADESRKNHTLIVIAPDHDTAGFAITGPDGILSESGDVVNDGWVSGDHTATDVVIWSKGPGCQYLGVALDNTDLFHILKDVMK